MRILLAFENSLSRDFAQNHLATSDSGLVIMTAASLADALVLANEAPDLAVVALDLQMPDMRGLQGLRRFRRDCRHRVPVAVMDSRPDTVSVADLTAAGISGFLPITSARMRFWGRCACLPPVSAIFPLL